MFLFKNNRRPVKDIQGKKDLKGAADVTEQQEQPNTPEILLRPYQAAALLGVTAETLRSWYRAGALKAILTVGGQHRFPTSEIERILSRGVGTVQREDSNVNQISMDDLRIGGDYLFEGCSFPACPKYKKYPCERSWNAPPGQSMEICPSKQEIMEDEGNEC